MTTSFARGVAALSLLAACCGSAFGFGAVGHNAVGDIAAQLIKGHRAEADRLKQDPDDGTDRLQARARTLETERDIALRKDPYFDWSQALLQIAIVLASVHLIIGNLLLLGLSAGLGGLGVLLMINGYTLWVALPLLG